MTIVDIESITDSIDEDLEQLSRIRALLLARPAVLGVTS